MEPHGKGTDMSDWMDEIRAHGVHADIGGEPGAWLKRVAESDGLSAASSQADMDEAGKAGAPERIISILEAYPDPLTSSINEMWNPLARKTKRSLGDMLAWNAARHVIIKAGALDQRTGEAILPEDSKMINWMLLPRDPALSKAIQNGSYSMLPVGIPVCDVYYLFALYSDDPVGTLKTLRLETSCMITRYAMHMRNRRKYGLTTRGIIRMGEQCAREGDGAVSTLFDILARAHVGTLDDVVPVNMDTIMSLTEGLPEGFITESSIGETGMIGKREYTDRIHAIHEAMETAQNGMQQGTLTDMTVGLRRFVSGTLPKLNVKNRAEGLDTLRMAADMQHLMYGPCIPSQELMNLFWRLETETPLQAVRRVGSILSKGEDGLLRWSVFMIAAWNLFVSDDGDHARFSGSVPVSPHPREYGAYVDHGEVPEYITYDGGPGARRGFRRIDMTGIVRTVMERIPLTMSGFRKATGRGGEYSGFDLPRMMNAIAAETV